MAKVISLLSQKGGPGKTTLSILSVTMLNSLGFTVSVIDADYPQHSFNRTRAKDLSELDYKKQLSEKRLSKKKPEEVAVPENTEASTNTDETENRQAIERPSTDLSETGLYSVLECTVKESRTLLKELRKSDLDFVFVDVPGTLNVDGMDLLIEEVDLLIIPVELEFKSIAAALETIAVVRAISKTTPIAIVWTKVKKNHKIVEREEYEKYFKERFDPYIFNYILFDTVRVGQLINTITPIPIMALKFVEEIIALLPQPNNSTATPS